MKRLLFSFVLVACPPATEPKPDANIEQACAHLRELGCPEGSPNRVGRTCAETMTRTMLDIQRSVPTSCIVAAQDVESVRACGTDQDIRVRCKQP